MNIIEVNVPKISMSFSISPSDLNIDSLRQGYYKLYTCIAESGKLIKSKDLLSLATYFSLDWGAFIAKKNTK